MSLLQRPPIDVEGICYSDATIPLREYVTKMIAHARSFRPYAAVIVRHGLTTSELGEINGLEGLEKTEALSGLRCIRAINRAVHDSWEADPWAEGFVPTDLELKRVISDEDSRPHVDQRFKHDAVKPDGGLVVAVVMLEGEGNYGLQADRRNPFDPKHRNSFQQTVRPRPSRPQQPDPPIHAGDVLAFMAHTTHFAIDLNDATSPRVTAAFGGGFEVSEQ